MRVTSAIFLLESPQNDVQRMQTASGEEREQGLDEGVSKAFISLYRGNVAIDEMRTSADGRSGNEKRRGAARPQACFAFSIEIRVGCTKLDI